MDENIILAREEALNLLDLLWDAYDRALQSLDQVEAMRLVEWIEKLERRIWS